METSKNSSSSSTTTNNNNKTKILVVLTLERHRHGVWISKLVDALNDYSNHHHPHHPRQQQPHQPSSWTRVQVVSLESLFPMNPNVNDISQILLSPHHLRHPGETQRRRPPLGNNNNDDDDNNEDERTVPQVVGIVNRVSDAAPPELALLCLAVLQLATAAVHHQKIPIFNGPTSYSLCTQKWCHHAIFRQAQLSCPATRAIRIPTTTTTKTNATTHPTTTTTDEEQEEQKPKSPSCTDMIQQRHQQEQQKQILQASKDIMEYDQEPLPHLIKPNAGGFGVGIERIVSHDHVVVVTNPDPPVLQSSGVSDQQLPSSNAITLIQSYHVPEDGYIYRVWLLCGKVQCGMKRRIPTSAPTNHTSSSITNDSSTTSTTTTTTSEFTSGCAGGSTCAWKPKESRRQAQHPSQDNEEEGEEEVVVDEDDDDGDNDDGNRQEESPFEIWEVSEQVRRELEDQLIPVLPKDFHAGSVEFLWCQEPPRRRGGEKPTSSSATSRRRLYFDWNLLSTLPVNAQEQQLQSQFQQDVWSELAMAIASVCCK